MDYEKLLGYEPRDAADYFKAGVMAAIVEELMALYTLDEAMKWISLPHDLLDGKSAQEAIHDGELEKVVNVIERLLDGVYL